MAKSLRSKWKRKMRAVKRERYGAKELTRLNEMLEKAGDIQFSPDIKEEAADQMTTDVENASFQDNSVQFVKHIPPQGRKSRVDNRKSRKQSESNTSQNDEEDDTPEKMQVDGERIFSKRTMRDQFGNYPDWMNKKKIRTQQKKNKRLKKRTLSVRRKN